MDKAYFIFIITSSAFGLGASVIVIPNYYIGIPLTEHISLYWFSAIFWAFSLATAWPSFIRKLENKE